jgi:hypothetical protein
LRLTAVEASENSPGVTQFSRGAENCARQHIP